MIRTLISLSFLALSILVSSTLHATSCKPNYIVIFCDDLGYGDLGCYGSQKIRTPHIDSLARDGMKFTDFYSCSPVCTPSRASLLTGSYARRVGMHEDFTGHWVLIPRSRRGLNPDELTLPEALKTVGYKTACIGKWHLGLTCQRSMVSIPTMGCLTPMTWPAKDAVTHLYLLLKIRRSLKLRRTNPL